MGRIAFTTTDGNLWMIKPDGSERVLLGINSHMEEIPKWSPDGKKVAFLETKTVFNFPLRAWRIIDVSVPDFPKAINRLETTGDFEWAGDSNSALYSEDLDGIYEFGIEGGRKRQFLSTLRGTVDKSPAWSPNGNKLVFVHYELSTHFYVGLIRNFESSRTPYVYDERFTRYFQDLIELVDEGVSILRDQPFRFQWSPNNQNFIYAAEEVGEPGGSLFYFDSTVKEIAEDINRPARHNVDLSNDGNLVAFAHVDGLRVMNPSRTTSTLLVEKPALASPNWSPDGKYIAYIDSGRIFLVSDNGSEIYQIPDVEDALFLSWSPTP